MSGSRIVAIALGIPLRNFLHETKMATDSYPGALLDVCANPQGPKLAFTAALAQEGLC